MENLSDKEFQVIKESIYSFFDEAVKLFPIVDLTTKNLTGEQAIELKCIVGMPAYNSILLRMSRFEDEVSESTLIQ